MAHFIDRRLNSKGKSTVNRQRFIKRYKQQISALFLMQWVNVLLPI